MALVGRWTLDGRAFDSSGQGNNGTVTGALYTNGKGSPGLWFDGTDDKVDCGTGTTGYVKFSSDGTVLCLSGGTTSVACFYAFVRSQLK
jgi:hypothetical protein